MWPSHRRGRLQWLIIGTSFEGSAFTAFSTVLSTASLQEIFPSQLGNVGLDEFYKGVNKVEPSFIRVEADEATYNLHIMLRMEIEIALLTSELAIEDLPEYWNTRFQEYLGVTPPDDAKGVLQDVHWSFGLYGYFSTYALGNLMSVQLWEKILEDILGLFLRRGGRQAGESVEFLVKIRMVLRIFLGALEHLFEPVNRLLQLLFGEANLLGKFL